MSIAPEIFLMRCARPLRRDAPPSSTPTLPLTRIRAGPAYGSFPDWVRVNPPSAEGINWRRNFRACRANPTLPSPVASRACPTCALCCATRAGPGCVGGGIKGGGFCEKGHAQTRDMERDDDSRKSHPALRTIKRTEMLGELEPLGLIVGADPVAV